MVRTGVATVAVATMLGLAACDAQAAAGQNGRWMDPGLEMTAPSEHANEAMSDVADLVGWWAVDYVRMDADSVAERGTGTSRFGYLNRGHALVERFDCEGCGPDGLTLHELSFWVFNPAASRWAMGVGRSVSETITIYDGPAAGEPFTFTTGTRPRGGIGFVWERVRVERDDDGIVIVRETSTDGERYELLDRRELTRSDPVPADDEGFGHPDPSRPDAAAAFDFLVGEWTVAHDLTMASGQQVKFPARSWAIHVLGGRAVLEHNQVDVDPNLPDAATSILRIYNRAERRWESLYTTNRFNGLLHFGGNVEGDRIVLHPFQAGLRDATIDRWVFHDIEDGRYRWTGSVSRDRGRTFTDTWLIAFERVSGP